MTTLGHPWRSVARDDLQPWLVAGWSFSMSDTDKPGSYIVEWRSDTAPVEPKGIDARNAGGRDKAVSTPSFGDKDGL